ncbi:unnamed protein product [Prorocentrum cordatum]|uniref:Uncharacterized protein n=1 Tax=Prorocentrum cordatum TaxID=2364126 RepID=A0ABN9XC83_9DINO|nr:unnamed protein product [Polarella glacialis]
MEPDPSWKEHTTGILQQTIGRPATRRGEVDAHGRRVTATHEEQKLQDRIDMVVQYCNWNVKSNRLVHYEKGCGRCSSRDDACANVADALLNGQVIPDSNCTVPCKHRFGSCADALREQSAGIMISQLLRRSFDEAFPTRDAPDLVPEHEEDDARERRYIKGKVYRSKKALADSSRCLRSIAVTFVLQPLEWVWSRLQHLDDQTGTLALIVGSTSPFRVVQTALLDFVNAPSPAVQRLLHHYMGDARALDLVQAECLHVVLCASSFIWFRFERTLEWWPFKLLLWANNPGHDYVVDEFFATPRCCLEDSMSIKLRDLYGGDDGKQKFLDDDKLKQALRLWGDTTKMTNMHIERLLARLKEAGGRESPFPLERLCADGFLSEFVRCHVAVGGRDCRVWTRADLSRQGVPAVADEIALRKASQNRGGARGWMVYAREQELNLEVPLAKGEDRKAFYSFMAQRFRDLPPRERRHYRERALERASARRTGRQRSSEFDADAPPLVQHASSSLWGLSSPDLPVDSDLFVDAVRCKCAPRYGRACSENEAAMSFNRWGPKCRGAFQKGCYIVDKGYVPEGVNFKTRLTCQELHPGFCCTADRLRYKHLRKLNRHFLQFLKQQKCERSMLLARVLSAEGRELSHVYLYCTHVRQRDPAIGLFVQFTARTSAGNLLEPVEEGASRALRRGSQSFFLKRLEGIGIGPLSTGEFHVHVLGGLRGATAAELSACFARPLGVVSVAEPGEPALVIDLSSARLVPDADEGGGDGAPRPVDPAFAGMEELEGVILGGFNEMKKPKPQKKSTAGYVIGVEPECDLTVDIDPAEVAAAMKLDNDHKVDGPCDEFDSSDCDVHVLAEVGSDSSEDDQDVIAAVYTGKAMKHKAPLKKADALPGVRKKGRYNYVTVPGYGVFAWDIDESTLNAHCDIALHNAGISKCHMNRQLTCADPAHPRRGEGRPLGHLAAWLLLGHQRAEWGKKGHQDIKKALGRVEGHPARLAARNDLRRLSQTMPEVARLFALERPPTATELASGGEPLEIS